MAEPDNGLPKMRKKKFRKASKVKTTLKRGSAIIRNFQETFYAKMNAYTTKADPGLTDIQLPVWQQLAVKMLMAGHPKAFIEFFELTQQPQPPPPSPDYVDPASLVGVKQLNDAETLNPLKVQMEDAEMGGRIGDNEKVYQANLAIGKLFENILDYDQSLFYFIRCLNAATSTKNQAHVGEVKFCLGRVYWKLANSEQAVKSYEQYITIATAAGDIAGVTQAAENLLQIHQTCAEGFKEDGNIEKSIKCYERAMKAAELAQNFVAAGMAKHKLGKLHLQLKQAPMALTCQTTYLKFCISVNDKVGEGKAHAAIAEVYESVDELDEAVRHMESYLQVAGETNPVTQAKAACKTGMLYQRHNHLQLAEQYFALYFDMARTLKDVRMEAVARVNLGAVRSALKLQAATEVAQEESLADMEGEAPGEEDVPDAPFTEEWGEREYGSLLGEEELMKKATLDDEDKDSEAKS